MGRIYLKKSRPAEDEGERTYPAWRLSGFRNVAHFIYEDGEYLEAACGTFWWMSDDVTSNSLKRTDRRCKHCLRTKRVREHEAR